jgi:hypothetical protein
MNFNYWLRLVRGTVQGTLRQQIAIAFQCFHKTRIGEVTCTWHEAAMLAGTDCFCQKCAPHIKKYC